MTSETVARTGQQLVPGALDAEPRTGIADYSPRTGATALQALVRKLDDRASADFDAAYDGNDDADEDPRDYRAMAAIVEADLYANLTHPAAEHRQGYLRAITDLLCAVGEGCSVPADWDPISNTSVAFSKADGVPLADIGSAGLVGAALYDRTARTIGEISAASFHRDGKEDHQAMVGTLLAALQEAIASGPAVAVGFALPLVDLIDCRRLGIVPADQQSGAGTTGTGQNH